MRIPSVLSALAPLGLALALAPAPAAAHPPVPGPAAGPAIPGTLPPAGEGRRLFLKYNCYSCHGMYGGGGMGPNLRTEGGEAGDVREAVLHGEDKGMRSFRSYFSSTDLDNMVAYLRSLGTPSEPTFKDWWVANPPK